MGYRYFDSVASNYGPHIAYMDEAKKTGGGEGEGP